MEKIDRGKVINFSWKIFPVSLIVFILVMGTFGIINISQQFNLFNPIELIMCSIIIFSIVISCIVSIIFLQILHKELNQ
jgi:hypothetical protein